MSSEEDILPILHMDRVVSILDILTLNTVFSSSMERSLILSYASEILISHIEYVFLLQDFCLFFLVLISWIDNILDSIRNIHEIRTMYALATSDEIGREPDIMRILDILGVVDIHRSNNTETLIDILAIDPAHRRVIDICGIYLGREAIHDSLTITCHMKARIRMRTTRYMVGICRILDTIVVMESWQRNTLKESSKRRKNINLRINIETR
jgi:hypothetical protein